MAAAIELPYPIDPFTVERAWMRAKMFQKDEALNLAEQGMRAAKARDKKLLLCLGKAAEIVTKMHDNQRGEEQRTNTDYRRATAAPVKMLQEAYRLADEGKPIIQFAWIYASFGELAGVVI